MPYRLDIRTPPPDAFDRLVDLGALDVETIDGSLAAIMPDTVDAAHVANLLGVEARRSAACGRDDDSVWLVNTRPIQVGRWRIVPADAPREDGTLRMMDSRAFGTGLHPTTTLCLEALHDELSAGSPPRVLDVGTGTGVLALAALCAGVPRAVAIDIAGEAVRAADENARLNGLRERLHLVCGGPGALSGAWPLVVANILAAPLIEMAPALARLVGRHGRLVLSGIRASHAGEVAQAYTWVGMRHGSARSRDGWTALTLHASW